MPNREPLAQITALTHIGWPSVRQLLALAIGALLSLTVSIPTHAANNAALQRCRRTVGKPIVQSCMKQGQGDRASCRQQASPAVRHCMMESGSMGADAMAGREARRLHCKDLAYQRGFNGGFKDRGGVAAFVKSCMQGKIH